VSGFAWGVGAGLASGAFTGADAETLETLEILMNNILLVIPTVGSR
jgi:hypothetical protein